MPITDDVVLKIDGQRWSYWEQVELTLSLDSFDLCAFTSVFEPDDQDFRNTFKPFTFKPLTVEVDNDLLFSGQLVGVEPKTTPSSKTVECQGYALPAVLSDVNAPESAFPIEFNGMTLQQIADQLAAPFGVQVEFDAPAGAAFRRVKMERTDKVFDFLTKLAKQRSLVISNTAAGRLRFFQSVGAGVPVVSLREGEQPCQSIAATFSPQAYFSEITGFAKTKAGRRGSRYTVQNPKLPSVVRPLSYNADDVRAPDLPTAVQARMARMFGNMVAYVVELPTWRDPAGGLFAPNTLLTLEAPGAMVYNKTTMLIRDVVLRQNKEATTASLGLVLPGAFSGQLPEVLPWD